MAKSNGHTKKEMRNLRIQQVVFAAIGLIVILSMLITMIK